MELNINSLSSISCKFTEETLKTIFRKATNTINVEITCWELSPGVAKGCNFLSVIHRVIINGIINDNAVQLPIIVKALPSDKCYRKTFKSLEFFKNEIIFYSKVLPAFQNFIESKNQSHLLNVPKCFTYFHDGENDFIALEDITAKGFQHYHEKQNTWTVESMKIILEALAKFHGISLALYHQIPAEFFNVTEDLTEMLFSKEGWEWYKNQFTNMNEIVKTAMTRTYPNTYEEREFNSLKSYQLFDKCIQCCEHQNESPLVVNHGDCWAFNFMSRIKESGERDAVIFDFQLARRGNPVLDLSYFIYTSTDKATREKHFDKLLEYYYSQLRKAVSQLGFNIDDIYPENFFMKDVQELFAAGILFALDVLPMMLAPDSAVCNQNIVNQDEALDVAEIWKIDTELSSEAEKRIADVVLHAMQRKFISG